jgi:hypothetical protein
MTGAAARAPGPSGEELLHDPILERMERDDGETAAGFQDTLCRMQRAYQFSQLVVHRDS